MAMVVDEVSVLRDAHYLDKHNTDLCPELGEPAYEIARTLCEAGYLEISVVGRILGTACYRLTAEGKPLAAECFSIVEADRNQLRLHIIEALSGRAGAWPR